MNKLIKPSAMTIGVMAAVIGLPSHAQMIGKPLPMWQEGMLDIHHINTGRGEASFFRLPDGTTMLVDASGATTEKAPFTQPTRPNNSKAPGAWVADYIKDMLGSAENSLDYAMISHFHGDHMGLVRADSPSPRQGNYKLSGITQVAEHLKISKIIDRAWPSYAEPIPLNSANMENYKHFLGWHIAKNGLKVERFKAGQLNQVALVNAPARYPQFSIRNIYSSGNLWTGANDEARSVVPADASGHLDENKLSIAFRLSYGAFDYFTGGDLTCKDDDSLTARNRWMNVETPIGRATGEVDAMKANHHGSWDANCAPFLRALKPRVIVIATRADGHPAINSYRRMTSQKLWKGPRDIFLTNLTPATATTTYGVSKAAATQGHIVIRVAAGGASYQLFVLDDSKSSKNVIAVHGPYQSR